MTLLPAWGPRAMPRDALRVTDQQSGFCCRPMRGPYDRRDSTHTKGLVVPKYLSCQSEAPCPQERTPYPHFPCSQSGQGWATAFHTRLESVLESHWPWWPYGVGTGWREVRKERKVGNCSNAFLQPPYPPAPSHETNTSMPYPE